MQLHNLNKLNTLYDGFSMEIGYITLTNIRLYVWNTDKSHEIERKRMDQVSNYLISLGGLKYQFSYAMC